jgi:hypothetical protein
VQLGQSEIWQPELFDSQGFAKRRRGIRGTEVN